MAVPARKSVAWRVRVPVDRESNRRLLPRLLREISARRVHFDGETDASSPSNASIMQRIRIVTLKMKFPAVHKRQKGARTSLSDEGDVTIAVAAASSPPAKSPRRWGQRRYRAVAYQCGRVPR